MAPCIALCTGSPAAAAESWNFNPAVDSFDDNALFELRAFKEKNAGQHGFVTLSADGNDFVLGDGTPAHFWGLNAGTGADHKEDVEHEARFLAKHGVNVVRLHVQVTAGDGSKVTDVNMDVIDRVWHVVAEMKKAGIYSVISPYWAGATGGLKGSWGIQGHSDPWGVLFCDKILQDGYHAWMQKLYGEKNPYTGVPLAQEPAVAVIQLQNEDSLLFWTLIGFINGKGAPYDELRADFGAYAIKKYGSLDKAYEAWGGTHHDGDDAGAKLLGFNQVWETTSNPGGGAGERVADQIGFLATEMYEFNKKMEGFMKGEIGCKQLFNATNWRTADTVHQNDTERWAYTANEVSATNKYFSTAHVGPDAGWAVDQGDGFQSESITRDPLDLPTNIKMTVGQPFMITESSWVLPNLYLSEGPSMVAAYSALNGLDIYFWFASSAKEWDDPWYHFRPIGAKWSCSHPMGVGQFPAAAWMFRHGYVSPGAVVVHEERTTEDMFHEAMPLIAEEKAYDPNRDADKIPTKSAVKTGTDPLAFLVGRVEVVLGAKADPAKNKVIDLKPFIDHEKKTITSTTKQLVMDTDKNVFTVNAPKAQSAAGFLGKAGPIALKDVVITCANDYATIMVVALDNKPIAESRRILVQIGTTTRASNWADHEGDFPVDDKGNKAHGRIVDNATGDQWAIESASGTVAIKNPLIAKATIADPNAMAAGDATGASAGGIYTLTLPPHALYVVLTDK